MSEQISRERFREITKDRKAFYAFLNLYTGEVLKDYTVEYHRLLALALRDEFDFGQARISRVLGRMNERIRDVRAGTISGNDIAGALKDETGIEVGKV